MPFQPRVNEELVIDGVTYHVAEHPAAPGMPYGQEGRQAIVYQLVAGSERRALKVFKPRYRIPALVGLAERLAAYADRPGLSVCHRVVLTPQQHTSLLQQEPDLTYSVLMPWIEGPTWMEVMLEKRPLTPEQCLTLAHALAEILAQMEQQGIAHCDLSASNVMLPALAPSAVSRSAVALVDVEQLYAPGLERPNALPSGSSGYAHQTASESLWSANADRFAGAVLIAEMLGWCDERVREAAWGESYFAPDELQRDTARYHTLLTVLRERWGEQVAGFFERAWQSKTLAECATFGETVLLLPRHTVAPQRLGSDSIPYVEHLITQAQRKEKHGDLTGAITTYREAIARLPEKNPLREELVLIASILEKRNQVQEEMRRTIQQADSLAQQGKWKEAVRAYEAALTQWPEAPQASEWRAALKYCSEEADLERMFDGALEALQRGERAAARELLSAILQKRPDYTRRGQRATTLLEQTEKRKNQRPALVAIGSILLLCLFLVSLAIFAWQTYSAEQTRIAEQARNAVSAEQTRIADQTRNAVSAEQTRIADQTRNAVSAEQTRRAEQTRNALSAEQTRIALGAEQTRIAEQTRNAFSVEQTRLALSAEQTRLALSAEQTRLALSVEQTRLAAEATLTAIARAQPPPSGSYYNLVAQHSGKCLNVQGASFDNNAHVIQSSCSRNDNFLWRLVPKGGNVYEIVAKHSGKCLTVAHQSSGTVYKDAHVVQWDCFGGSNQRWSYNIGGYAALVVQSSGLCLDVPQYDRGDDTHILVYGCNGGANQLFLAR